MADDGVSAASSSASDAHLDQWDVERLRKELKKHTETRDQLLHATTQMQGAVENLERMVQDIPNEDNIWRGRYLQQHTQNQQLEANLKQLERKLAELRSQQGGDDLEMLQGYKGMSNVNLRQLLRRLEKEKAELEWQLKDSEWRLDQEATAVHKSEEEKKAILTELGQASLELEKCKRRDHLQPPKLHAPIKSSPQHSGSRSSQTHNH